MNFVSRTDSEPGPRLMKHGDLTIIYERHDSLNHIYLSTGEILNNKFGAFYHDDIIGKPFGSKIISRNTTGWMYALEPSPELWSLAVHTRTQIVNELDASIITLNLDVFPGCIVVESGTGSGCMTLSLARAIAPTGHVYTFEYNPSRAKEATEEFRKLGVGHLVTTTCKDVCGKYSGDEGGFSGVADQIADAVFLDLPEPWLAIDHVMRVLKPGRNLCTYSPCIEQVMKTCDRLRECGFHSIRMIEVRQRPYDGRRHPFETVDLGFGEGIRVPPMVPDSGTVVTEMKGLEEEDSSAPSEDCSTSNGKTAVSSKRGASNDTVQNTPAKKAKIDDSLVSTSSSKMVVGTSEKDEVTSHPAAETEESRIALEAQELRQAIYLKRMSCKYVVPIMPVKEMLIGRPLSTMKGHTAFLTFAVRPPLSDPASVI